MCLNKSVLTLLLVLLCFSASFVTCRKRRHNRLGDCENLKHFEPLRKKIQSYQDDVNKIVKFVQVKEAGQTWRELAQFCDTFGPRLSGSQSLTDAIEYLKQKMSTQSRLNVTAEPAMIPKWEVHNQWAEIIEPRKHKMSILALGSSVSTNGTIERQVQVVHDFDELDRLGRDGKLRDRIVVYNYKFINYPTSVVYRTEGALRAAKYGAAAALIRSVTPFSIYSPHAGMGSRSIPTAAIALEDADFMERITQRGQTIKLRLHIKTQHFDDVPSFNLIGDITGSSLAHEVVLVSGHMDSWYNTDGALDDGGGMMVSYRAIDVLQKLGLRGERTMRAVLWTSEEFGLIGARQYFENHKHELQNFKAVIESDEGTFTPLGWGYKNLGPTGQCVLLEVLNLLKDLQTDQLTGQYEGSDIEYFSDAGVPALSLLNKNDRYFYFHHTSGDSMTVENPQDLDTATALFASTVYILSNLDVDLRD